MEQDYEAIVYEYFKKLLNNDKLKKYTKDGMLIVSIAKNLYKNRHYDLLKGLYLMSVYALVEEYEDNLEKLNEDIAKLINQDIIYDYILIASIKSEDSFSKNVSLLASKYINDEEIKKDLVS